ncbi:MAG: hypothetical protein ACK5TH_22615 [Prosthecobacter sp.]
MWLNNFWQEILMKPEDAIKEMVVQFGWSQIWIGILILGALQFLIGLWIKARLEGSIKHEYDKLSEEYKYDIKVREQAAKVAAFLAKSEDPKSTPSELNQLSWELSLWLPVEIYHQLAQTMCNPHGLKEIKEVLIAVRKFLLRDPNDKLTWDNIIQRRYPPLTSTTENQPQPDTIANDHGH